VGLAILWPDLLGLLGVGAAFMSVAVLRFRKSLD